LKGETPHDENQGGGKLTPLLTTQLAAQVTVGGGRDELASALGGWGGLARRKNVNYTR